VRSGATKAFGEARWHHLIEGGETEAWLTTAMLEKAKSRGAPHVSGSDVATWAATTYSELTATRPAIPRVRPRSRAVIWLVGRSFDPAVFRQVRLWRRAGLDARCLILDARQSKRTGRWIICVQREFFPQRDEALESLAANQAAIEGSPEAVRLDLEFYDARPPSDDEIERGGLPLDDETRVVVRGWNDETKVLYRAKGRGA
jgi:hypothetical protein